MFRLCFQGTLVQTKTLSIFHKEIVNLKCLRLNTKLIRHFASYSKVDSEVDRIYYGPLTPQIKAVKVFSLSSSVAGLVAQPIIINEAATIGSTSLLVAICSVVGFFTFVTPILLHQITKKYVTKIDYDSTNSTYKAVTYNFFIAEKQHEFKAEDVIVPEIPGMFTTLVAKGKPMFVEARHFSDPMHYAKMMGYDKPMDFKMGASESSK
ncbi:transmembrane protein 70 homolog, mitochondrial [Leguminivora glycinivorella]|uniref:transmembrane protein 70 homolog, mitochondrial n=1 Tax=Leguminivora glycinivorella TaxID=1035111 RepID=UPI00201045DA|nr:transmembrane protein 70 homolog, mitochondrial [Leguminivora glycinivorella]